MLFNKFGCPFQFNVATVCFSNWKRPGFNAAEKQLRAEDVLLSKIVAFQTHNDFESLGGFTDTYLAFGERPLIRPSEVSNHLVKLRLF